MRREYTVYMKHIMRSVVTVEADNEREAKVLAYSESFVDQNWEEIDTEHYRIDEGPEVGIIDEDGAGEC